MATTKTRINITAEPEIEQAVRLAAQREGIPVATKAAELISIGLALEEDIVLARLADQRSKTKAQFVSHDEAWQ